jgi:hypothetical protein
MSGGRDLLASERGMWCIALATIALALVLLEVLSGAEWVSFMQWVTITLVVSKTVTGVMTDRAAQPTGP